MDLLPLVLVLAAGVALGAAITALIAGRARRKLRHVLDETRRRLKRARSAREDFFDLTTHELRSPLSVILGYQELLDDGSLGTLPPEAMDAVDRLGHAARHLVNLVDGLMELTRLRDDDVRLDLEPVDLTIIALATADVFRTAARERGLEPTVDLAEHLPTTESDRDRLVRALDLVITSAVRHPDDRSITLRVTTDGNTVSFHVGPTDLDVAPPEEGDPRDHGQVHRLGLRLAVARRVGELLGGGLDLPVEDGRVRAIQFRIGAPHRL